MADIDRADLSTIIQDEYSNALLESAVSSSVALQAFRRVDLGTKTTNLPVLATLPEAEFVSESASAPGGVKPTSQITWGNKQIVAEEIAVIVPIHENVVADAVATSPLDEIARQGGAAIGRKLDGAVLFGVDKPVSWTSDDLLGAATTAGNVFEVGTGEDDLVGAIFQAAGAVDTDGWEPDAAIVPKGLRYRLANLRDADNRPIFLPSLSSAPGAVDSLAGLNAAYASGLVWDRSEAEAFVVDSSRVVIGVRQDITVKFLDQATVGGINLAERDMVAVRFKARYGYVLGDTRTDEGDAPKTPVSVVTPNGS